jgi:hypothetical protein
VTYIIRPDDYEPLPRSQRSAIEVDVKEAWVAKAMEAASRGRVLDSEELLDVILDTVEPLFRTDRISLTRLDIP